MDKEAGRTGPSRRKRGSVCSLDRSRSGPENRERPLEQAGEGTTLGANWLPSVLQNVECVRQRVTGCLAGIWDDVAQATTTYLCQ